MRKIIVTTFMTMDGVLQAPGGPEEDRTNGFNCFPGLVCKIKTIAYLPPCRAMFRKMKVARSNGSLIRVFIVGSVLKIIFIPKPGS